MYLKSMKVTTNKTIVITLEDTDTLLACPKEGRRFEM
jgi:hypothetical protein